MKTIKKTERKSPITAVKVIKASVSVKTKKSAQVAAASKALEAVHKDAVTIIKAKIDVGFGNNLFVRGQGAGLSWEQGTPLVCVDGQTWRWNAPASDKVTFKLLLNDSIWSQGEDLVADAGKEITVTPRF